MLPPTVRDWRDAGRWLPTRAGKVFVRSGPGDAPTLLLLHGFPSSSYDFRSVLDHLGQPSWLTLDFLGFGLSDKPRPHRYSLLEQADIVQQVADAATAPVATTNVLDGSRELRPAAAVVELPELGHYPQVEDPAAFADAALGLLRETS